MSTAVLLLLIVVVLNSSVMRVYNCSYDPIRDLKAVEPFGYIDAKQAFVTGSVPSQLPDSDSDYNGIDDPASILGKPVDVFDAIAMQRAVNDYVPPTDNKDDSQ